MLHCHWLFDAPPQDAAEASTSSLDASQELKYAYVPTEVSWHMCAHRPTDGYLQLCTPPGVVRFLLNESFTKSNNL